MFSRILIGLGLIVILGTVAAALYFAAFACVMVTTGCIEGPGTLLLSFLLSRDSASFWAIIVLGLLMAIWGWHRKTRENTDS